MTHIEETTLGFSGILARLMVVSLVIEVINGQLVLSALARCIQRLDGEACINRTFLRFLYKRGGQVINLGKMLFLTVFLIIERTQMSTQGVIITNIDVF